MPSSGAASSVATAGALGGAIVPVGAAVAPGRTPGEPSDRARAPIPTAAATTSASR